MGGVVPPGALWAWGAERKGRPGSHGGGGGRPAVSSCGSELCQAPSREGSRAPGKTTDEPLWSRGWCASWGSGSAATTKRPETQGLGQEQSVWDTAVPGTGVSGAGRAPQGRVGGEAVAPVSPVLWKEEERACFLLVRGPVESAQSTPLTSPSQSSATPGRPVSGAGRATEASGGWDCTQLRSSPPAPGVATGEATWR